MPPRPAAPRHPQRQLLESPSTRRHARGDCPSDRSSHPPRSPSPTTATEARLLLDRTAQGSGSDAGWHGIRKQCLLPLLFASLGHLGPSGVTIGKRHDGENSSDSNNIARMLPAVAPSATYSRSRGRTPEQRAMPNMCVHTRAVFGVIAGNSALSRAHADAGEASS